MAKYKRSSKIVTLNMNGPYGFNSAEIDHVVTQKSPGNYALGYTKDDSSFVVEYVGRSDKDVNQELKAKLKRKDKKFKYSYASSPKAAFEKECQNYHDFGESEQLDNENHPDRPDGTNWKCPVCTIFD